jgi:hypothetical protein
MCYWLDLVETEQLGERLIGGLEGGRWFGILTGRLQ